MLQSFVGTVDANGLRTLRPEGETATGCRSKTSSPIQIWAILDSSEIPSIQQAMMLGRRGTALQLLLEQSQSRGQVIT